MYVVNGVKPPRRATPGSIGYDFYAPMDIALKPGRWTSFGTGVMFTDEDVVKDVDKWAMLLLPRSGLGFRHGVRLKNTVGVIDCDYRGEIRVSMSCDSECYISKGDAYMQGVIIPIHTFEGEIEPTQERDGGFGSTDK